MKSIAFAAGVLWATPSGANQTPVQFGVLQDVSVDFSFTTKQLMGQYQFAVAVGRGAAKISGKAHFAQLNGAVINTLFFNQSQSVGQTMVAYNEAGSIPATPFTVTVSNSATWDSDLGVTVVSTGAAMTRVASAPTTGQYSVAAGAYLFAAADTSKAVLISYRYTSTTSGSKATIGNNLMGVSTTFQIDFMQNNPTVSGDQVSLRLFSCLSSKLTWASKLEDFTVPEFDFEAFSNSSNQIGEFNTGS
jgi:hypothetical protein